jgi:ribosome maturation factor RimP
VRATTQLEHRILDIIAPAAADLGYEIVRLRVMGAKRPRMQVMAERADGLMDVEDCAKLSRALSPVLDVSDPIDGEYTLEVSSPGIDRPLTRLPDFDRWASHEAKLETARPIDGRRRFSGILLGREGNLVRLRTAEGPEVALAFEDLSQARLVLTDALIDAALSVEDRAALAADKALGPDPGMGPEPETGPAPQTDNDD